MKRRLWRWVILGVSLSSRALSGDFSLEPRYLDQVYESAVKGASVSTHPSTVTVEAGYARFLPEVMVSDNDYFVIDYRANLGPIDMGVMGVSFPLYAAKRLAISASGRVGYAYNQGIYQVRSRSGAELVDAMSVQWLGLSGGAEMFLTRTLPAWISPGVRASGEMVWLYQLGSLDAVSQGFVVPVVSVGPALVLFGGESRAERGFVGMTIAGNYRQSVASPQTIRGWSGEAGVKYAF